MKEKIIEIIRNTCVLDEKNITLQTKLKDLSMDSFSFVEAIVNIEQMFDIMFDDEDLNIYGWETVGDLVHFVEGKVCR